MEIKRGSKFFLTVLNILSWIIFIWLCIEVGGILFNTIYALYKPIVAQYYWNQTDFSALYAHDKGHFIVQTSLMFIVAVMKALIFWLIAKLSYDKNLSLDRPFNPYVTKVVFSIAYLCLGAGIFSNWGGNYASWLKGQGVQMPDIQSMSLDGGNVWLFMAFVLMVIGLAFKKGSELQTESELTV